MQIIKDSIRTVIVSLVTLSLVSVAYAVWTEPASNPPAGNTSPPITTASTTQTKTGWFTADNIEAYGKTVLATVTGNVGIGTTNPGVTYKLDVAGAINTTGGLYVSGTRKDTVWDGKQDAITAGTTSQYWRGDKTWQTPTTSQVTEGTNLYFTDARAQTAITGAASTIATSNLTANRALMSDASGKVAVSGTTSTELGYVSGVTSAIQTQLNTKAPTASPTFTGSVTMPGTGIWNSSGYVGVGTVGPVSKLHVYQDSDVWHTRIGGGSGELRIGGQNPYGAVIQAYTPAGATRNLLLQPNGGSVAIGTVSPGTDKLYVQGNTYLSGIIRGATYGFGGMYLKVGTYCEQTNPLTGGCTCPVFFTAKTWNNSFRGDGALGYSGFSITHCYR